MTESLVVVRNLRLSLLFRTDITTAAAPAPATIAIIRRIGRRESTALPERTAPGKFFAAVAVRSRVFCFLTDCVLSPARPLPATSAEPVSASLDGVFREVSRAAAAVKESILLCEALFRVESAAFARRVESGADAAVSRFEGGVCTAAGPDFAGFPVETAVAAFFGFAAFLRPASGAATALRTTTKRKRIAAILMPEARRRRNDLLFGSMPVHLFLEHG